jgi:dTDP-4-amino-4,6-dideoxygalactose transaminase
MSNYRIPFNKPCLSGMEMTYIAQAVQNGHISGDGPFSRKCHAWLENAFGVPKVLLTTSCTHALELAAFLLDLKPGDEVITPAFTFVSTINAFVIRGARPVFADIRRDTLNLDEKQLEKLISPRTRAILVVHYAGVGCEMDTILDIAQRHHLPVIEDNAHGLFGRYRGRALGTFGCLATQSFHETKNITCGEGGFVFTSDYQRYERMCFNAEPGLPMWMKDNYGDAAAGWQEKPITWKRWRNAMHAKRLNLPPVSSPRRMSAALSLAVLKKISTSFEVSFPKPGKAWL